NLCVAAALAALRERVQEEVGGVQSATEGVSLIERLRGTRKPAAAAAMSASPTSVSASASASTAASAAGSSHRAKSIKLATRHFDAALKKVAPSSSDQMESLIELRKWDKMYGDGAQERKHKHHSIGFGNGGGAATSAVAVSAEKK
ncbi:hypothetical protein GGF37_007166, partial [Kickxella alabastrina]